MYFVGLFLLEILHGLTPLAIAWNTKLLFDLLGQSFQRDTASQISQSLLILLVIAVCLTIVRQIIAPLSSYLNAELGRQLTLNVQSRIFEKINSLQGLAPIETPQFHDAIQLAAQRAQTGPAQILDILTILVRSSILLGSFVGVLVAFNSLLAGLVLLAVVPQFYIQIRVGNQRLGVAVQNTPKERLMNYYGHVLSTPHFAKEVRIFNLSQYFLRAFRHLTIDVQHIQRNQQIQEFRWQTGLGLLTSLISAGIFVTVVIQAFSGKLSLGDVMLYISAVDSVQQALYGIVSAFAGANENILFFTQYTNLLALQQPIVIPLTPRPVSALTQGIEIRNVSFRYSTEHPWILRNINLSLPAGQSLALVGLNGVGKTTLVKLLSRMYDPSEGQILWDGVDIRDFDPVALRHHIGAIFQDFVRFDLTAHENIALGDVDRLEKYNHQTIQELVHQAASKVGIHEVIMGLPQGYKTVLSRWLVEGGQGIDLSGGEWQKIALARMFMRDADVLILDEPTATLDAQAEYDVYRHFVELVAGKTSLLISHRFSTVRMANLIAVLEDGRVSECGSHEQLLSLGGTYKKLYTMQAKLYK